MSREDTAINCDEVRRWLVEKPGAAMLPPEAEEHIRKCADCRELVRVLEAPPLPEAPSPETLRRIERSILADLRPVRPVRSMRETFAVLAAIFAGVVALGIYWLGANGVRVMSPLEMGGIIGALVIGTGLIAVSVTQQVIPASRHWFSPTPLPLAVILLLAAAIVTLFPMEPVPHFWPTAWACIERGVPVAGVAGGLSWVVLRGYAVLSPVMTGAAAGLLAGLAGETTLQIYCPIMDARHILVAHLSVAVLCTAGGVLIGCLADVREVRARR